jgi:hypothetical protein
MSSTACARWVLSPATLHSVISTVLCRCITRPIAVADRWPTVLTPGCSCPVAQSCLTTQHCDNHYDLPTTHLVCI